MLDPSRFEAEHGGSGELDVLDQDRTDVGPAPTAASRQNPARVRALAAAARRSPAAKGPVPATASPTIAKPGRPEARRPYLADAPKEQAPDPLEEARRSADDLSAFFRSLNLADRIAWGASALLLLSLVFPWRWTKADDDTIGMLAAFPALVLGAGIIALVYVRARRANAALANSLAMAQLAASFILSAFCGWFLRNASEERVITGAGRAIASVLSQPEPAAYAGTACALVAFLASAAALAANRRAF